MNEDTIYRVKHGKTTTIFTSFAKAYRYAYSVMGSQIQRRAVRENPYTGKTYTIWEAAL